MSQDIPVLEPYQVPFRSFTPFLLITFGLAWGILGLYVLLPDRMGAVFGQLSGNHPLFFLAVYAPAIASFTLVLRHGGFTAPSTARRLLMGAYPCEVKAGHNDRVFRSGFVDISPANAVLHLCSRDEVYLRAWRVD